MKDKIRHSRLVTIAALALSAGLASLSQPLAASERSTSVGDFRVVATFPQPDGKLLLAGGIRHRAKGSHMAIARRLADGTADTSFNSSGLTELPVWGHDENAELIAVQPDGRILVGGIVNDPASRIPICVYGDCGGYGALFRLKNDGTIDPSFHGGTPLILHLSSVRVEHLSGIELDAQGGIVLHWFMGSNRTPMFMRINPDGSLDRPFPRDASDFTVRPVEFAPVIEYYNNTIDHYFMTADRAEFIALDSGQFGGWQRTGEAFRAWMPDSRLNTVAVCRLYGNPALGLNTHFFGTASGSRFDPGCDELVDPKYGGAWILESSDVFRIIAPDQESTMPCPSLYGSSMPIFRFWNRRSDTNHRYTGSVDVFYQMINRGYASEGTVMCASNPGFQSDE